MGFKLSDLLAAALRVRRKHPVQFGALCGKLTIVLLQASHVLLKVIGGIEQRSEVNLALDKIQAGRENGHLCCSCDSMKAWFPLSHFRAGAFRGQSKNKGVIFLKASDHITEKRTWTSSIYRYTPKPTQNDTKWPPKYGVFTNLMNIQTQHKEREDAKWKIPI